VEGQDKGARGITKIIEKFDQRGITRRKRVGMKAVTQLMQEAQKVQNQSRSKR
jgi:hypothetical protein